MQKIFYSLVLIFGLVIGFLFGNFTETSNVTADNLELDDQTATVRVIKSNLESVASVVVYEKSSYKTVDSPMGGSQVKEYNKEVGRGSGFVFSDDGYIVTNRHVLNSAKDNLATYKVVLNSGIEYDAKLIGKDPFKDLAVLKIEAENLRSVKIGDSDKVDIGITVVAIGNSMGRYQNSVTKGIISGLERDLTADNENLSNVFQTDAEINVGNSGGPLLNLNGEVIGINVAKDSRGSSIGFAIPINDARPVIDSIKKYGRIIRPIMGVRYQQLTPKVAGLNHLNREDGAWIRSVLENSPARNAGILPGDIIFEVNAIHINEETTLASIIQNYKPGDRIGVKIQRNEKVVIKIVKLGEFNQ